MSRIFGDARRVQGARAAERHQDVVAGIAPTLGRDELDGPHDVGIGQPDRAVGHLRKGQIEVCRDVLERPVRSLLVDRHGAAEKGLGTDRALDDVRVGDGRAMAAPTVAGRTRLGARALRAHAQHAAVVHPNDAAAAGANRHDVEQRRAHRKTVDAGLAGELGLTVLNEAHVGARAPHVEGDETVESRLHRLAHRAHDPRRRPREERGHRVAPHARARQAPAVGLHETEASRKAARGQMVLEPPQVLCDHRLHVGRDDRGRGPLVLPELGRRPRRTGDDDMLEPAPEQFGQRLLVSRIGVGVQEADRDRLVVPRGQCRNQRPVDLRDVERSLDRTVGENAFGHLEAVARRHDRRRLLVGELEHEVAVMSLDRQDVPESAGRDEGDPRSPALQHGVGRHGGAVDQLADVGGVDPRPRTARPRRPRRGVEARSEP